MTTKEKIIEEALTLFSVKGFKGTSVKNIADAVGIKDSSLYKHFRSKQEILDSIVLEMRRRMEDMSVQYGFPDEHDYENAVKAYGNMTEELLLFLSKKAFLFYLKDSFISRFWKMAVMEQFHDPGIYQIYQSIFMVESIAYQTKLFQMMIREGYFAENSPEVMAVSFYSPIFFLLSKYIGEPEKEEEALEILEKQVKEFYRIYHR